MRRLIGSLLLVLVLSTACACLPAPPEQSDSDEETPVSVDDAIERGFPVRLPAEDVLRSMGIAVSPTVSLNTQDNGCSYLLVKYYYEDKNEKELAMSMQVSDGCVATFWRGYTIELSWAVEGKATLVEENKVTPIIIFYEPVQQFQYVVFSEEPLSNTLKLLESMK